MDGANLRRGNMEVAFEQWTEQVKSYPSRLHRVLPLQRGSIGSYGSGRMIRRRKDRILYWLSAERFL